METFVVEDALRHDGEVFFWEPRPKMEILGPNRKRIVEVPSQPRKLDEYRLLSYLNDTGIASVSGACPMSEKDFLVALFLLVREPSAGESLLGCRLKRDCTYLFHVSLEHRTDIICRERVVTVFLEYQGYGSRGCSALSMMEFRKGAAASGKPDILLFFK